jgi:hypothetical protein
MVMLKTTDARVPLSEIKLDQLKQDFNVYGVSSSTQTQIIKGRRVSQETLTLTLYPLRSGSLQLPALRYQGNKSAAILLQVRESGNQIPRVMFKSALDTSAPRVRQAATLSLEIYDDGSLQWNPPREVIADGAHQTLLAESQREERLDGVTYTVHHYAWVLMPLREGGLKVAFPLLDAFKFGTRLRYAVAPLWLNAAAVPAYLPVYVPIGKPDLEVEPLTDEIALNRPTNWRFSVQSRALGEEGLAKLLATLKSNQSFYFYPPEISAAARNREATATQTLQVNVPFIALKTGNLTLPDIALPYYDPERMRVDAVRLAGTTITVFNPVWRTISRIALGVAGLLVVALLAYWITQQLRHAARRQKSLRAISGAKSADELRLALLNFDCATPRTKGMTLQQWLACMQRQNGRQQGLLEMVEKLQRAHYAKSGGNMTELAREAAHLLRQTPRRKIWRGRPAN